jgi:hypothetical protein
VTCKALLVYDAGPRWVGQLELQPLWQQVMAAPACLRLGDLYDKVTTVHCITGFMYIVLLASRQIVQYM